MSALLPPSSMEVKEEDEEGSWEGIRSAAAVDTTDRAASLSNFA